MKIDEWRDTGPGALSIEICSVIRQLDLAWVNANDKAGLSSRTSCPTAWAALLRYRDITVPIVSCRQRDFEVAIGFRCCVASIMVSVMVSDGHA